MAEDKKIIDIKNETNSFELALRILGNEFVGIRLASTNASGKMILWAVLLLFFTFMTMEIFGFNQYFIHSNNSDVVFIEDDFE